MDLKQLRYFVQVAELGSFAKASDVLDVAQPTLSRHIRALELDLKTSLLHRHGRGAVPTAAGARFLEQAYGVLHAADAAVQVLQTGERRFAGHVACGMTPSIGHKTIAEYVRRFNAELPDATLTISNQVSTALQEHLAAGRLDFAVIYDPVPSPHLDIVLLRQQSLFVLGSSPLGGSGEVAMRLLAGLPLVLPTRAYAVRRALELAAAQSALTLQVRSEVDVLNAIFDLVAEGEAYTVATEAAIIGLNRQRGLSTQRLVGPEIKIDLSLVTPLQRRLTPLQNRAAEIARCLFPAKS